MSKSSLVKITSELLHEDKVLKIRAVGCSMLPLFKENDQFIIQKKPNNCLAVGDIIIFVRDNTLIAHRIFKIKQNTVVTWGDFNLVPDQPIIRNQIIAQAIGIDKQGKTIMFDRGIFNVWRYLMTHNAKFNHKFINIIIRIYLKCKRILQIK